MSQTRKRSWLEAGVGTAVGMGYAIPLNYVMVTKIHWSDWWIYAVVNTVVFTVLSVILKFIVRRFFNWLDIQHPDS